jgi:cytoplasmic iron level regulating protein YaaA (DUF328/UPF0246 family)
MLILGITLGKILKRSQQSSSLLAAAEYSQNLTSDDLLRYRALCRFMGTNYPYAEANKLAARQPAYAQPFMYV